MAQGYAAEQVGVLDGTKNPAILADGRVVGARMLMFQATLDMAAATTAKNSGDTNVLFKIPGDCKPVLGWMSSSATMGATATIAIGKAGTPAKYRAAAVFATPDVPTFFMLSSASDDAPLSDPETVIMTIAAAALPGAGILQVFMLAAKI